MPTRHPHRILLLAAALLLGGGEAAADRQTAARFFSAGQQAFEKGDYLTAIRAFEQSYAAQAHPSTLFSTAQAYRRQYLRDQDPTRARQAVDLYRRFLKEAPRSPWSAAASANLLALLADLTRLPPASQPRPPAPVKTQLMITSKTPGARVTIDGEPPGGEPAPAIRTVSPGEHIIRGEAPGHLPAEEQVTAVKDRLIVASLNLRRRPGSLRVLSDPVGGAVHLNGKLAGSTPLERDGIAPGEHDLVVSHRGRQLWRHRVTIAPGRTAMVMATPAWSGQRKAAVGTAASGGALALAGLVCGLLAIQEDAALDGLPLGTDAQRRAWDDRLMARDRLATSSTALLSTAGAALVTAALLYWFDLPAMVTGEAPHTSAPGRISNARMGISF